MPRLTDAQRNQAIGMLRAGLNVTNVARQMGCTRQTIHSLRNKFNITGSVRDLARSGRPPVTTLRDDRMITLTHLRNRFFACNGYCKAIRGPSTDDNQSSEEEPTPYTSPSTIYWADFDRASSCCQAYVGKTSFEFYAPSVANGAFFRRVPF